MENQGSKRGKPMFSFFKPSEQTSTSKKPILKSQKVEIDVNTLERDPGIQILLWQHLINQ